MNDIANCPFCNSPDVKLLINHYHIMPSCSIIKCNNCGARGPIPETDRDRKEDDHDNEAKMLWNNRPCH